MKVAEIALLANRKRIRWFMRKYIKGNYAYSDKRINE